MQLYWHYCLKPAYVCIHLIADLFLVFIASPGEDFSFTVGTKLNFTAVHTSQSWSDYIVIPINHDDIVEETEFFTCSFQKVSNVQVIFPSQVTIEICDDDGKYITITPCSLTLQREGYTHFCSWRIYNSMLE